MFVLPGADDTAQGSAQETLGTGAPQVCDSSALPRRPQNLPGVDPMEIDRLCGHLVAHIACRQQTQTVDPRGIELARIACMSLLVGSPDLGTSVERTPECDLVREMLRDPGPGGLAEARVARLWLAHAVGELPPEAPEAFIQLGREPLWPPIRALVFRGLAYYGLRHALKDLLTEGRPVYVDEADACFEAAWPDAVPEVAHRLTAPGNEPLPAETIGCWAALLAAEHALAATEDARTAEYALAPLVRQDVVSPPHTYAESINRYVAARTVAAWVRARIAQQRGEEGLLASSAGLLLPAWEREYLLALTQWVTGNPDGAASGLRRAMELNPHQTSVRLALAVLTAEQDPLAALSLLEVSTPTREMLVSRAAILTRLGRYEEAEAAITWVSSSPPPGEPIRFTWFQGRQQCRVRETALRTALAQRRGDWVAAEKAWQDDGTLWRRRSLPTARNLLSASLELRSGSLQKGPRRDDLEKRKQQAWDAIGSIPLLGSEMFFRAAAVVDSMPDRAARDFQTLLAQPAWLKAECRVGAGRVIFAGDALARMGFLDEGIRAYAIAAEAGSAAASERLAFLRFWSDGQQGAVAGSDSAAGEQIVHSPTWGPWPHVFAAVGLVMASCEESAREHVQAAEAHGAPPEVCLCIRALCDVLAGAPSAVPEETLVALGLSPQVDVALRMLIGPGGFGERARAFVRELGGRWLSDTPLEPRVVAALALGAMCSAGEWDEALAFADGSIESGQMWAADMAALVRVWHALTIAVCGQATEAETELLALASQAQLSDAQNPLPEGGAAGGKGANHGPVS